MMCPVPSLSIPAHIRQTNSAGCRGLEDKVHFPSAKCCPLICVCKSGNIVTGVRKEGSGKEGLDRARLTLSFHRL